MWEDSTAPNAERACARVRGPQRQARGGGCRTEYTLMTDRIEQKERGPRRSRKQKRRRDAGNEHATHGRADDGAAYHALPAGTPAAVTNRGCWAVTSRKKTSTAAAATAREKITATTRNDGRQTTTTTADCQSTTGPSTTGLSTNSGQAGRYLQGGGRSASVRIRPRKEEKRQGPRAVQRQVNFDVNLEQAACSRGLQTQQENDDRLVFTR